MPQPKSRQAAWGNGDGRTTWFYGFWDNEKPEAPERLILSDAQMAPTTEIART